MGPPGESPVYCVVKLNPKILVLFILRRRGERNIEETRVVKNLSCFFN